MLPDMSVLRLGIEHPGSVLVQMQSFLFFSQQRYKGNEEKKNITQIILNKHPQQIMDFLKKNFSNLKPKLHTV